MVNPMRVLRAKADGIWFWVGALACIATLPLCGIELQYLAAFVPILAVAFFLRRKRELRQTEKCRRASPVIAVLWLCPVCLLLLATGYAAIAMIGVQWRSAIPVIGAAVWLAGFYVIDRSRASRNGPTRNDPS